MHRKEGFPTARKAKKPKPFTKDELAFIEANYPHRPARWRGWDEGCPGRSWRTIGNKARAMGLRKPHWSAGDDARLLKGFSSLCASLGRSPQACAARLHSLCSNASYRDLCDRRERDYPEQAMRVWAARKADPSATQARIAELTGASRSAVSRWLRVEGWESIYAYKLRGAQSPAGED